MDRDVPHLPCQDRRIQLVVNSSHCDILFVDESFLQDSFDVPAEPSDFRITLLISTACCYHMMRIVHERTLRHVCVNETHQTALELEAKFLDSHRQGNFRVGWRRIKFSLISLIRVVEAAGTGDSHKSVGALGLSKMKTGWCLPDHQLKRPFWIFWVLVRQKMVAMSTDVDDENIILAIIVFRPLCSRLFQSKVRL